MRNASITHAYRIPAILAFLAIAAILAFTTIMTVSAQAEAPDWKVAPTGLNVMAGDQPGEIDITWDPHPQTSKTLSDYRGDLEARRHSLPTQGPEQMERLPDHQRGIAYRPGRRRNLPGQSTRPLRRRQDIQMERHHLRTGRRHAQQPRQRSTNHSRHGRGWGDPHRRDFRHRRR